MYSLISLLRKRLPLRLRNTQPWSSRLQRLWLSGIVASPVRYVLILFLLASCQKAEDLYSGYPAYFVLSPVTQAPELYTAVNSYGEFCTITPGTNAYIIANLKTSTPVPHTALDQHVSPVLGLDGLLVGLPNVPEMGFDQPRVVCFDLCCPNCYRDYGITRRVTLLAGGLARCPRCTREYDLNALGIITSDTTGIALFRYRTSYNPMSNTFIVQNR